MLCKSLVKILLIIDFNTDKINALEKFRLDLQILRKSQTKYCLKQELWLVYCKDGTKYSPEEYAILKSTGQPIPLQVHIVKKIFDGVLVSAENRP